jgi:membrane associated rhomboid family serine protease
MGRKGLEMLPVRSAVPTRYAPVMTWVLIAVNCGFFLLETSLSPAELEIFLSRFALIPARYFPPDADLTPAQYLPFISNAFLHGGWLHLILNMWTLWIFGPTVEDRLGSGRYLLFYLFCGVLASATHAFFNPTSTVPALGASGAIAGVLGCYVRFFPFARLVVVIPIIIVPFFFEVPAIIFAGIWFLLQLVQGTTALLLVPDIGGVAWWAHVGGFLTGFLLGPLLRQPRARYRAYYGDEGVLGFDSYGRP